MSQYRIGNGGRLFDFTTGELVGWIDSNGQEQLFAGVETPSDGVVLKAITRLSQASYDSTSHDPDVLYIVSEGGIYLGDTAMGSGGTVDLAAAGLVTSGGNTAGRVLVVGSYNHKHTSSAASLISGGNATQPNYLGKKFHRYTSSTTGTTYDVDLPFTLDDPGSRVAVRAKKRRLSDGAVTVYSPGSGVSATGYGTAQLTVTVSPAVASGEELEITVISTIDDTAADPTLVTMGAYDSVVSSIMTNCWGAHSLAFSGAGHNTIAGGSYHRVSGSYNTIIGGTQCDIGMQDAATVSCSASGQSVRVDGTGSFGLGINLSVRGTGSGAFGRNATVPTVSDAMAFMHGAKPLGPSEFAVGCGRAADAGVQGIRQYRTALRSADTTNATTVYLTDSSGTSEIPMRENSAASVEVSVVAVQADGSKCISFAGTFLVSRIGSGPPTVNGVTSDVTIPAINNIGAPGWTSALRGISAGFRFRATGDASATVRWMASARITYADMSAT